MTLRLGTRTLDGFRKEHPAAALFDRSLTRDVGMSKLVTASMTFHPSSGKVTAANGTFAPFVAGDPIVIEGTNLNNGERVITAVDAANQSYLVLDAPPQSETATATVRTP